MGALAHLNVTIWVLCATIRHTLGAINLLEFMVGSAQKWSQHPAFLVFMYLLMFLGYYPFAKERTEGGFEDFRALISCQNDYVVSKKMNLVGVALSSAFIVAQVALVDQNPIIALQSNFYLNLILAIASCLGMSPSSYNTIMRIFAKSNILQSRLQILMNMLFGGLWSLIGAYASISAVVRLIYGISYAKYGVAVLIAYPSVMLNYDTYSSLKAIYLVLSGQQKSFFVILGMAWHYFISNWGSFSIAFINVLPQIGFAVVTVTKDIENHGLMVFTMILVLLSNTSSNWFMRGLAVVNLVTKLKRKKAQAIQNLKELVEQDLAKPLISLSGEIEKECEKDSDEDEELLGVHLGIEETILTCNVAADIPMLQTEL